MKNFMLLFFVFCLLQVSGQDIISTNYIQGNIKVPIIVDQIEVGDHFLDDRRDYNNKIENVYMDIDTDLKRIPIYFWGKGTFNGTLIEEVYDFITVINIHGNIDPKTNLGTITVQQKETKNVKAHPMNVCDYDYEYSYYYKYKNLSVRTVFPIGSKEKDTHTSYFFKPNENTVLTVKNYKYLEDTKCPKRNYSKEFVYKQINESYLNEKLASRFSYFNFNINWNGGGITDNESIIYIISEVEDSQFKSMLCDCPTYNNQDQFLISYADITDILLNRFNPDQFLPEYSSGENVLKQFDVLKENLENKYGISIISESSIKNNELNKNKIISKIEVPLNDEGKDFCNLLRRIMESVNQ